MSGSTDWNDTERRAARVALDAAGQFLDPLPTADMAQWDFDTFERFINCIIQSYIFDVLKQRMEARDAIGKLDTSNE